MNNFEDIKRMTVVEMASFIQNIAEKEICDFCIDNNCNYDNCAEGIIKWLRQDTQEI